MLNSQTFRRIYVSLANPRHEIHGTKRHEYNRLQSLKIYAIRSNTVEGWSIIQSMKNITHISESGE